MIDTNCCLTSRVALGSFLMVVAVLVVFLIPIPAYAIPLTVNSKADPGTGGCNSTECTLREAISASNGLPTTDTIKFAIPDDPTIPGVEVKTISPAAQLPVITDNVTIDGYTQAGAEANDATTNANNAVLKVELSGRRPDGSRLAASGLIIQVSSCLIRGLAINRFGQHGVLISESGNKVEGSFIGTNPGGTADLGNGGDGVRIESSDNLVGGPANAAQNVISGNDDNGVTVDGESAAASGNVISNNHIGTDADAEEDLGNSDSGVHVFFAPGVVIGGNGANGAGQDEGNEEDGEGNIISGNNDHGVLIDNIGASGARVLGNYIGPNRNGNGADIGNTLDGVRVSSTLGVEVGGTLQGQRNTISDNGQHGVEIVGTSSTNVRVLGNRIGTNFNGNSEFGNAEDGVRIGNASNILIGGTTPAARNVISDNGANGVFISGTSSATSNRLQGNFIGTDVNGTRNFGNGSGVFISDASGNTIGGTVAAAANTISLNRNQGVIIVGDTATGNSILRNSIFGNGIPPGLSIDLNDDDVTANDAKDPDTGPNGLQNFPVLTSASETRIEGRLNSRPGRNFTIQFFSNPPPVVLTGFREGTTFLGEKTVTTNGEGRVSFAFDTSVNTGEVVTATATIQLGTPPRPGNTSEFSATRLVQ